MKRSFRQLCEVAVAFVKTRNAAGDFVLLAYAALIASMVLLNNYDLPPRLFWLLLVPTAFFASGSVALKPAWPSVRFSLSFTHRLGFSLILLAALIYVLFLTLSSWSQPGFNRRAVDQTWAQSGEILLFMTITANAVAYVRHFLLRLIAIVVPLVSISAALNVWSFLPTLPTTTSVTSMRLVNWLGMPGYSNSTNISVTYAVYFAAALAVIIPRDTNVLLRLWLAPFAAVLLIAILLTQSRGAYIGTAVSASLIFFLATSADFWKRNGLKLAAVALVCGVVLGSISHVREIVADRGSSLRPEIWKIYASKAIAKPMLGYGNLSNIDITIKDGTVIDQPHNLVLSGQIRGGVFAMLAMVVMLAGSAWWACRFWRHRRCLIPLAVIATIFSTGMFDYNLLVTGATWPWLTFWLPFAMCGGAEITVRSFDAAVFD